MKMSLQIHGGKELAAQLGRLEKSVSREIKLDALRAAAEPIRAQAASLAPRDDNANAPHLADNIVIGTKTEKALDRLGRDSETVVEVGPAAGKGGDDFFYGYFQEHGTAFHQAQPFLRPAFDSWAPRSLNILVSKLWRALKTDSRGRSLTGGNL